MLIPRTGFWWEINIILVRIEMGLLLITGYLVYSLVPISPLCPVKGIYQYAFLVRPFGVSCTHEMLFSIFARAFYRFLL